MLRYVEHTTSLLISYLVVEDSFLFFSIVCVMCTTTYQHLCLEGVYKPTVDEFRPIANINQVELVDW